MFADSDDEKKPSPGTAAGPESDAAAPANVVSATGASAIPAATTASSQEVGHAKPVVAPAAGNALFQGVFVHLCCLLQTSVEAVRNLCLAHL
jgi:hypothetical protein